MNDRTILHGLQSRDQDAYVLLEYQYKDYIKAILGRMLAGIGTPSDVEELLSDTLFAAWQHAGDILPGKLKSYLGTTCRNKAKDWLRRRRELPMDLDTIEIPDSALSLEDQLLEQELANQVRRAVDTMADRDREIFLRYYYYLQPTQRISAEMNLPHATVRSRLARGRKHLQKALQKEALL